MAEPVTAVQTIGSWSARDTDAVTIDAALQRLRGRQGGDVVRVAVLTLVVLVDERGAASAAGVVRELAARSPIHTLVVASVPGDQPRIDARVNLCAVERQGQTVRSFEEVFLRVAGLTDDQLRSVEEHWLRWSVPVVVWSPSRTPAWNEHVVPSADEVIVDGVDGRSSSLTELVALSQRVPVADLSWLRLAPWREVVAGMFAGNDFSPFLGGVRHVEAEGDVWSRLLLAGWIASRLQLARSSFSLDDADRLMLRVVAEHEGHEGSFAVEERSGGREVHATATIDGDTALHRTSLLTEWSPARVLDRALGQLGRDAVWEQSLARALELSGAP